MTTGRNAQSFVRNRRSDPFFEVSRPDASDTSDGVTWVVRYPASRARVWVPVRSGAHEKDDRFSTHFRSIVCLVMYH